MIRDDIMKLMKESYERGQSDLMESCKEAAAIAIATAILAERNACLELAKKYGDHWTVDAIRARGTHETTI
jgi:hypothetical protein